MREWRDFGIELPSGASGEVDTLCPQCSHTRRKRTHRCLSVNVDIGTWNCHHCGWSGGIGLGETHKTGSFTFDPHSAPIKPKVYEKPRPIPEVVAPTLWDKAAAWFQDERAIPEHVLTRNHIAVAREYCPVCEEEMSHVLYPYYRGGVHINTKHRCVKKHFRMERGAERVFYGLDDVKNAASIVIVEGENDKLACEVAGFLNVLSVPDGAPAPDAKNYTGKFSFLESEIDLFTNARDVVIAVDADLPGQTLQDELTRRIGREKCRIVTWPDGIKDANDCLKFTGPEELTRLLHAAEPVKIDGIWTLDDLAPDLDNLYENGFDPGIGAGWLQFDKLYRVRGGLVTIVTGIPGHGKSAFLDAMLVNLAIRHDWRFALCSFENQPIYRHAAQIMTRYADRPFNNGPTPRMGRAEMEMTRALVGERFAFVLPEEPTVDSILERVRILVFRMGVKGVVIDPWNEIEHSRPKEQSVTEYVSTCLGKLRRFARLHDVHLWIVAHPTKLRKTEDGKEPVPSLYDISDSAHFRNKADFGITVWRDLQDQAAAVEVHVTKVRFAELGSLGMGRFIFDPVTGRYGEVR